MKINKLVLVSSLCSISLLHTMQYLRDFKFALEANDRNQIRNTYSALQSNPRYAKELANAQEYARRRGFNLDELLAEPLPVRAPAAPLAPAPVAPVVPAPPAPVVPAAPVLAPGVSFAPSAAIPLRIPHNIDGLKRDLAQAVAALHTVAPGANLQVEYDIVRNQFNALKPFLGAPQNRRWAADITAQLERIRKTANAANLPLPVSADEEAWLNPATPAQALVPQPSAPAMPAAEERVIPVPAITATISLSPTAAQVLQVTPNISAARLLKNPSTVQELNNNYKHLLSIWDPAQVSINPSLQAFPESQRLAIAQEASQAITQAFTQLEQAALLGQTGQAAASESSVAPGTSMAALVQKALDISSNASDAQVLGITEAQLHDPAALRKGFRAFALLWHPDKIDLNPHFKPGGQFADLAPEAKKDLANAIFNTGAEAYERQQKASDDSVEKIIAPLSAPLAPAMTPARLEERVVVYHPGGFVFEVPVSEAPRKRATVQPAPSQPYSQSVARAIENMDHYIMMIESFLKDRKAENAPTNREALSALQRGQEALDTVRTNLNGTDRRTYQEKFSHLQNQLEYALKQQTAAPTASETQTVLSVAEWNTLENLANTLDKINLETTHALQENRDTIKQLDELLLKAQTMEKQGFRFSRAQSATLRHAKGLAKFITKTMEKQGIQEL